MKCPLIYIRFFFFFKGGGGVKVVKKVTFQEIELGALNLTDGQFVAQILWLIGNRALFCPIQSVIIW